MSSDFDFDPGPVLPKQEPLFPPRGPRRRGLSAFEKLCAGMAFVLAIALVVLGFIGTFAGCSAHFTLPPILGVIPAFVGWGIIRSVRIAWRNSG